jgi:phosphate-selective porin
MSLQADEPATDARLRALEHELSILRQELSSERSTNSQAKRPTDYVAGEYVAPPMDPVDRDDVFVAPKQSAVTELKVRGRLHYQFGYAGSDDYSDFSTLEWRRLRLGVSGKILDDWSFEIVGRVQTTDSATKLEDAYLRYNGLDWTTISFEHLRPRFGAELNTSSSKIKTVERSNISNSFDPGKITGLSFAGDYGIFDYQLGAYNGESGDQRSSERTNLGNEGVPEYLLNASIGLDFSENVGLDQLAFRLDYIDNSDDDGIDQVFGPENAWAASVSLASGPFSFVAEYVQAELFNGSELSGFYLMPSVRLSDKLEAVLRYETMEGDDGGTIRHQSRYARRVVASNPGVPSAGVRGEDYWALYGGVNYYVNKSLKLMFGVEYAELDDIAGSNGSLDTITGYGAVRLEF